MKTIRINDNDNVVVALKDIAKGDVIQSGNIDFTANEDIKAGHKIALKDIKGGNDVIKYGFPIGAASADINKGDWVHTHNIKTKLDAVIEYEYKPTPKTEFDHHEKTFMGYLRGNGSAGVRNEVWIIPTVGCINTVAVKLAESLKEYSQNKIDDICAFPHPYGCSQMGDDQENTKKILAGIAQHPNSGGVLILGLGCENCKIETLKPLLENSGVDNIEYMECQGVEDEVDHATKLLKKMIDRASANKREKVSASKLVVGLKCGGSDGFSGITANPLVGSFSDKLIALGGSTVLTEVPEMFGAETILMNRCKDKETFDKMVSLINHFKDYYTSHNQVIYENPSPGNKDGGISTLEDKSLGCIQKGGSREIQDVLQYGEKVALPGLNVLSAPGNDLVASTALAAAGAQIVLFTTGRGTPFGTFVPTVKISSNTELARKKKNWIDFNAGSLIENQNLESLSEELLEYVIEIASGEKTQNELGGFKEIAIFKTGVTL